MVEIFLKDRDIDYEMFVYSNGDINYTIKEKNDENDALYCDLRRGTIILDGTVLNNNEVTTEQIDYIKEIINALKSTVISYKKDYKPVYVRYSSGSTIKDITKNESIIEIPNRRKFRQWTYINAYNYLENFVAEYEKQKNLCSFKRRILDFLRRH